jgi:hypothetical protein
MASEKPALFTDTRAALAADVLWFTLSIGVVIGITS